MKVKTTKMIQNQHTSGQEVLTSSNQWRNVLYMRIFCKNSRTSSSHWFKIKVKIIIIKQLPQTIFQAFHYSYTFLLSIILNCARLLSCKSTVNRFQIFMSFITNKISADYYYYWNLLILMSVTLVTVDFCVIVELNDN